MKDFLLKKLAVAKGLNEGLINGSYVEAVLISCGLLSAIASEIWPGENIDRKRFIELLVKYDNSNLASRISLPLIINDSSVFPNRQLAINLLKNKFPDLFIESKILTCEIDPQIEDLILILNQASIPFDSTKIKRYSYANLVYKELRCGFSHEYKAGVNSSNNSQSRKKDILVSYFNTIDSDTRTIHFHFIFFYSIIYNIANIIDFENTPLETPDYWWIEE